MDEEDILQATGGFSESMRLSSNPRGSYYSGSLHGSQVAIWVPHQRNAVPWPAIKSAADALTAMQSPYLVSLEAVSRDGCAAYKLMPVRGTVKNLYIISLKIQLAGRKDLNDLRRTAFIASNADINQLFFIEPRS